MQLYIVSGELSGDKHGALMLRELKKLLPDCTVKGLGGPLMHAQQPGVQDWADEAAVVGFVEVVKNYPFFRRHFLNLLADIKRDRPEALVLIDYPGFNLRMAEAVRKNCPGTKIIYFISPQVWAWHKGRIPKMARILDLMLCIFPFEKPVFENSGLHAEFVGHPLVDDIRERRRPGSREPRLIGLFPGSRSREIERHFPVILEAAKRLNERHPDWTFETAASSDKFARRLIELRNLHGVSDKLVRISTGNYHELMDRASAGIVASGTATMEAALHELPFVLIYKVAPVTYWMAKKLIKIPYIGMVNILSDRMVTKELIQHGFTPETVSEEVENLMTPDYREQVLSGMKESVDLLGPGGAAERAAREVAGCLLGAKQPPALNSQAQ